MKRKPEHPQEPTQHKTQGAGRLHKVSKKLICISRNLFTTDTFKLPKSSKNSQTKLHTQASSISVSSKWDIPHKRQKVPCCQRKREQLEKLKKKTHSSHYSKLCSFLLSSVTNSLIDSFVSFFLVISWDQHLSEVLALGGKNYNSETFLWLPFLQN